MNTFLLRTAWRYHAARPDAVPAARRTGTPGYTAAGLIVCTLFLLTGAFGFNLTIQLVSILVPKQLHDFGASNTVMALLLTTLPSTITMVCNPFFSFWSDRTRSRFGRRRPFLFLSAPLIALCMVGVGWTPELAQFLTERFGLPGSGTGLALLGVFSTAFSVLFMFPSAILWYLFPDIIPARYIARFMAFYNVVAQGAGVVCGTFLLPFAVQYARWLHTAVALFFLLTMWLLIFGTREGEYPPVSDGGNRLSLTGAIRTYLRECYGVPFYYPFYLAMALSEVSTVCRAMFNLLYARNVLHVSLADYGKIISCGAVTGVALSVPLAWLSDRIHPMRFFPFSLGTVVVVNLFSFFLVRDERGFLISSILLAVVYTMQGVSTIPVYVEILPRNRYGQFSSANALFRALFQGICGYGGGMLFDWLGDYQYIFAWDFAFTLLALFFFLILCRNWRRRQLPAAADHSSARFSESRSCE